MNLLQLYYLAIKVAQPARVQDIYASALTICGELKTTPPEKEAFYSFHERMREEGVVISVRRGSYWWSEKVTAPIPGGDITRWLSNRRFFLMKKERRSKV